jgi:hypothetical protein
MSSVGDEWQQEFYESLITVIDATTLLLDSLLVAYVGADPYARFLDEFREENLTHVDHPARFLEARRELLASSSKRP